MDFGRRGDRHPGRRRAARRADLASACFVCAEDLAILAGLQRRRAGTGARLIDFPSGHHPFLSQPAAFADSIAAEIESAG